MVTFKQIFKHLWYEVLFWLMGISIILMIVDIIMYPQDFTTRREIVRTVVFFAFAVFVCIDRIQTAKYKAEEEIERKQNSENEIS